MKRMGNPTFEKRLLSNPAAESEAPMATGIPVPVESVRGDLDQVLVLFSMSILSGDPS